MTKIAKRIKERLDHNESVMDFIFCFNCYCRMMKQETSETIKKEGFIKYFSSTSNYSTLE